MVRRLTEAEAHQVWARLERRLGSHEANQETEPDSGEMYGSDHGAYPTGFEDQVTVATEGFTPLPDEAFLTAIREGMAQLHETVLYFLAREYALGDEDQGLEWVIPIDHLTRRTLEGISPGFECYLYSVSDNWAIYFHHEGFAFCGGNRIFIRLLESQCQNPDPLQFNE